MTKLSQLRPVTVVKALEKLGFRRIRTTGSHLRMAHPLGKKVSISLHRKPVPKGTLKSILRQADISLEQLLENL